MNFGISTLCKKLSWTPCNNRKKCGVQKILLAKKQEFYVVVSGLWHTCFTPISNTYKFQEKQNVWKSLKRSHFPFKKAFKQCVWCQNLTHVNFLAITVNKFWQQMSFLFYLSLIQELLTPLEKQQNLSILKSKLPLV